MTDSVERPDVELGFAVGGSGRTFLATQFVRYPFHVCRGLYTHARGHDACSVLLQSTSGGLFESDSTRGLVRAATGSCATVSTSASTIVHSMRGGSAAQAMAIEAGPDAALEYLPEPLILFPESRLRSSVSVRAHPSASVVFCESFLAHDHRAAGGVFEQVDLRCSVHDEDGRLLARDRQLMTGLQWSSGALGVAGRHAVYASIWLVRRGPLRGLLEQLRLIVDTSNGLAYAGASPLPNDCGIQFRLLCASSVELKNLMTRVLAAVRACTDRLQEDRIELA